MHWFSQFKVAAVLLSVGTDLRAGRNVLGVILNSGVGFDVLLAVVESCPKSTYFWHG